MMFKDEDEEEEEEKEKEQPKSLLIDENETFLGISLIV